LALTAAAALLTPKPRSSDNERVDIKRPDQIGPNRFTPTFAFDTVQELARLGQTVPIVFADQTPLTESQQEDQDGTVLRGGTRANSLMTFSMLSSTGSGQRLRVFAVAGFSGREKNLFATLPDYDGLAFGDQLVRDYNPGRIAAYFRGQVKQDGKTNDGPIERGDKYDLEDADYQLRPPDGNPSLVYWHPSNSYEKAFSGARNPSNESEFGAYSPMANGNFWKVDFQMLIVPDAAESNDKDRVASIRSKISSAFPVYGAITSIKGDKVTYVLSERNDEWDNLFDSREGVTGEDIANQVNQERLSIDAALNEGEAYILNNQVGILTSKSASPFVPGASTVKCTFTLTEDGAGAPPTVMTNDTSGNKVEDSEAYGRGVRHWSREANQIQKFSDALIANNVACECTEIGIGSTVWKRFQGSNVNNWPGREFITDMENNDAGGTFDMGRLDAYVTRYSFFNIQIRRQGARQWSENANGGGVFAVKGNTPVERFNAVRIYHPRGQYEFRMRPYPSKLAYYRHTKNGKKIYLLDAKKGLDDKSASIYRIEDAPEEFSVFFEGRSISLGDGEDDGALVTNLESIKGEQGAENLSYIVTSVTPTSWSPESDIGSGNWSNDPEDNNPRYVGPTYSNPDAVPCGSKVLRRIFHNDNEQRWVYYWDDAKVGDITLPGTGMPNDEKLIAYQSYFEDNTCKKVIANNNIRYQPRAVRYNRPKDASGKEIFTYEIVRKKRDNKLVEVSTKAKTSTGGSGTGLTFDLTEYTNGSYSWEIRNQGSCYRDGDQVRIKDGPDVKITLQATGAPSLDGSNQDPGWDNVGDTAPLSMITDYYHRNTESSSHKDRPEHRVTYVNEFVLAPDTAVQGNYRNLASLGFTLSSSKQLTSMTQLSAYYQQGLRVEKLGKGYQSGQLGASNIFPEIAWFLLTDGATGAGGIINKEQLDRESFSRAADFCRDKN
jgi:hypothetical protein